MIFLNSEDIRKTITCVELMDKIEEAFHILARGDYFMPDRMSILYQNKNLLFMPCFTANAAGTKILSVFPENYRIGKPIIHGLMVLNDYTSGEIAALLDGQTLTAQRTGAVGGVAMRHLAPLDTESLGVVGAGAQGFMQILNACAVRDIKRVYLYDLHRKDYTDYLAALRRELGPKIQIQVCSSAADLLRQSQLVVTATNSREPVLPDAPQMLAGKCYVAIGSYMPDMRELPDAMWQVADQVYTELPFACEESGDLCQPLERGLLEARHISYMGDFLSQEIPAPNTSGGQTVCFKSVGVGLFDLITAQAIYHKAQERGIGQLIDY